MAKRVFRYAERIRSFDPAIVVLCLAIWAIFEAIIVNNGISPMPVVSLLLGLIGTAALIALSVLIAKTGGFALLKYCGENSIVIYLAFSLFMGTTRILIVRYLPGTEPSVIALLSTMAGVFGPLILYSFTRGTRLDFLFHRPRWARVSTTPPSEIA